MKKKEIIQYIESMGFKQNIWIDYIYSISGKVPDRGNMEFSISLACDYEWKGDFREYNPIDNYLSLYLL